MSPDLAIEGSLHLLHDPVALEPWKPDWQRLASLRRGPTHGIEWAQASLATLVPLDAGPLHLFVVKRDGVVTGLAPMQLRHRGVAHVLEHMALDALDEPTDLLYEDEAAARAIVRYLLQHRLPFVLGRLPHDSCIPFLLHEIVRRHGVARVMPREPYPAVDLRASPEGELNRGRRSDLRRMRRKANELGQWRHEVLQPSPQDVPTLLERAIDIESQSWKIRSRYSLRRDSRVQTFLRDYMSRSAAAGTLRMAFAYIDQQAVAMQIAIVCNDGYWILKIGYDASYGSVAPGQLLMQDTLRHCAEIGLRTYELMGTAAEWTRVWTSCEHQSWRAEVYPPGLNTELRLAGLLASAAKRRLR